MRGIAPVEIAWRECANSETYEFWLIIGGHRVSIPVYLNVAPGQPAEKVAAHALKQLLEKV